MADADPFLSRATAAFVDRAPINWQDLAARASTVPGGDLVHGLRLLDTIRPIHTYSSAAATHPPFICYLVVAASAAQLLCAFVVLASAFVAGELPLQRGAQVVLMFAFSAAALLLFAKSRDARTVALLAWLAAIASLFGRSAVHGLPPAWFSSIDVVFRGISVDAFAPACLWRFALEFPRVERFTRFDVLAGRATTASWILGLVLLGINLYVTHTATQFAPLAYLTHGHPANIYWHVAILALIPPVGAIFIRARRAPTPERRKVARLAVAIAIGSAPLLALATALSLSPGANLWLTTAGPIEHLWLDCVVIGGLASIPLSITVAVIVDRPFELQGVLGPAAIRTFTHILLNALTIAPFVPLVVTLYEQRHGSLAQVLSGSTGLLLLGYAAVGCALVAVRRRWTRALDRYLSRRAMEHHQQLAQGLERIRLARGVRELGVVLERELRNGTGASRITVLAPDASSDLVDGSRRTTSLPADSALVAILSEATAPLDVSEESELRSLLPPRDRDWAATNGVALIVPLRHRDEEVAAVMAIGPKRRGLPFDDRDQWLITTLTTAAAATWSDVEVGRERGPAGAVVRSRHPSNDVAFECPRCGWVTSLAVPACTCGVAPVLAALPVRVGEAFHVQRRLGIGGMGIVYLARDATLGRDVALKTLPALKPGSIARLRDEARAMAALNHPSLATIYGLQIWRRTPVLVVEYMPNGTLAQQLTRARLAPVDAVSLGLALTRALVYMHARGVLHRDIKPSNIAFTATGSPKLLDFGLAVFTEPTSLAESSVDTERQPAVRAGTPAYLPPETFRGAAPSAQFDLWALSVVLMEAVVGVNPFADAHGHNPARAAADAADLEIVAPGLSRVLGRALDSHAGRRFQTASELLTALETMHVTTR